MHSERIAISASTLQVSSRRYTKNGGPDEYVYKHRYFIRNRQRRHMDSTIRGKVTFAEVEGILIKATQKR